MFFHWSLSDTNSPLVSRTLLSIWADLNRDVVWMVSIPRAPTTISTTLTFMLHHLKKNLFGNMLVVILCFVHIPFVNMARFLSLAQFPMDHLSHPVMSTFVFFLCQFAVSAHVINCIISVTTLPAFSKDQSIRTNLKV